MYQSAINRYASEEMCNLFCDTTKFRMWRQLWVLLAKAEQSLGLPITDEQIAEMEQHINLVDMVHTEKLERITHHDVMAHIMAYGEQCPNAKSIIHLGATSCYVTDNADVIRMREATDVIGTKLVTLCQKLAHLAWQYKDLPCLAYTHFQAAQPTTVGKRVAMWLQDFIMDTERLQYEASNLHILGCRGATGTAASFLQLFDGDSEKVRALESYITNSIGISTFPISGQTYTRKQDFNVLQVLSGIAQSASKFANDIRLLSHTGEVREGFGTQQVGSSAMPYKKNPITCECITSLSRHVICEVQNTAFTASDQWLERSLDDSANRRIVISDTFTTIDAIITMCQRVVNNLIVDETHIQENLNTKKLEIGSEGILMYCVKEKGMDRQDTHEILRKLITTGSDLEEVKTTLGLTDAEIETATDPTKLTGLAEQQVGDFLGELGILNA